MHAPVSPLEEKTQAYEVCPLEHISLQLQVPDDQTKDQLDEVLDPSQEIEDLTHSQPLRDSIELLVRGRV